MNEGRDLAKCDEMKKGRARARSVPLWRRKHRYGLPSLPSSQPRSQTIFACHLDAVAAPSPDDFLKHPAKHAGNVNAFLMFGNTYYVSDLIIVTFSRLLHFYCAIYSQDNIFLLSRRFCTTIHFLSLPDCALFVCAHRDVCALRLFRLCFFWPFPSLDVSSRPESRWSVKNSARRL